MITFLALSLLAHAVDRDVAEHTRLSEEIEQLAQRQLWLGVEKKYVELEKLGVELSFDDLMHGAYAARALGNMQGAYHRLKQASKIKTTKDVIETMYAIDENYGLVELITVPPRGDVLSVAEIPFDPDQRTAVDAAVTYVKEKGVYKGLLPKGKYVFAGQPFTVEPGIGLKIEVSPHMKKTTGEIVKVATTPTWGSGADDGEKPPEPTPQKQ